MALYYSLVYYAISCYIIFVGSAGRDAFSSYLALYILQRGVQWKQGVVIRMLLCTSLLCNTTPIHCTPNPLHPSVMNYSIIYIYIIDNIKYSL